MPSNERENKRKENQRKKDKKTKNIIYIVLIVILACLLIMKVCEINVSSVKNIVSSNSVITDSYPYELSSVQGSNLFCVNDKLVVSSDNNVTVLNPSNAKNEFSFDFGYAVPITKTAGQYILVFDQGGTRFRIATTSKSIYEKTTQKNIITANIAKNGTVAYATLDDENKSVLCILSKTEKQLMTLEVTDGYVTSVALNDSATKCSYTTVNSTDSTLITTVHTVDVSSKKEYKTFGFKDVNVYDLHYCTSNDFYVIGDNFVSLIKSGKKCADVIKNGEGSVLKYEYTTNNELVLNYSQFENDTNSFVAYITSSGKIKNSYTFKEEVKAISTKNNEITVLLPNKINVYSLTREKEKSSTNCSNAINKAITLSSKNYVLTGQSIDVLD